MCVFVCVCVCVCLCAFMHAKETLTVLRNLLSELNKADIVEGKLLQAECLNVANISNGLAATFFIRICG